MEKQHYSIAIDGPGGAVKSTIARRAAAELGFVMKDNIRQLLAVECTVHIEDVDGKLQCQVCQTDLLIIRHIMGNEICIHPGRTPAQQ